METGSGRQRGPRLGCHLLRAGRRGCYSCGKNCGYVLRESEAPAEFALPLDLRKAKNRHLPIQPFLESNNIATNRCNALIKQFRIGMVDLFRVQRKYAWQTLFLHRLKQFAYRFPLSKIHIDNFPTLDDRVFDTQVVAKWVGPVCICSSPF
jgi:hypothetical protein